MVYTRVTSREVPLDDGRARPATSSPCPCPTARAGSWPTTSRCEKLIENGQIATQYVDRRRHGPACDIQWNPNGSVCAIEGITSPDGRVLGKMGHSERKGTDLYKNVPGEKDQLLFESGVKYFK